MKNAKKLLSILLSCLMLMSLLSVGVFAAEGTQDNPINANDKWFGFGVDCFLMNTTLTAGDTDGVWYQLTADADGILQVEHSSTEVDYQLVLNVNGQEYLGYENGVYNKPIATLPVSVGDVITLQVIAQDTSLGGLVYCNAKFITGENNINQMVKLKGANVRIWIANGATVYLQDDSLQGEYAAMGLKLESSVNGKGITVISSSKNYTDTDGDGYVELKLGGSAGSTGVPAVKPTFAIANQSGQDAWFVLNVVENTAHECVYDNDADADCNTCGAIRDTEAPSCQHEYASDCDSICAICGEETREASHNVIHAKAVASTCAVMGNTEYWHCDTCGTVWADEACSSITDMEAVKLPLADHTYTDELDADCNLCGAIRKIEYLVLSFAGNSISQDVNGLAFRFDVDHAALTLRENTMYVADYANCTVSPSSTETYHLVSMGAVMSNNDQGILGLDYVDGARVLNVVANEVQGINEGNPFFVIRIVDIPEAHFDTTIFCCPYYIYENAEGETIVSYGTIRTATYNDVLAELG